MSETRFTPGPWSVEAFNEVIAGEPDYMSFILGPDGESILAQQISDANATLIAAAPYLYQALGAICKLAALVDGAPDDEWNAAIDEGFAALDKARGVSPNTPANTSEGDT